MVGTPKSMFDSSVFPLSLPRYHSHTLLVRSASRIHSSRLCLSRSAKPLTFLAGTANGRRHVSLGIQVHSDSIVWPCDTSTFLLD